MYETMVAVEVAVEIAVERFIEPAHVPPIELTGDILHLHVESRSHRFRQFFADLSAGFFHGEIHHHVYHISPFDGFANDCAVGLGKSKSIGVFHCYSGSKETAEIILKMGFYLGIGGVLTFKNSKLSETLRELNQSEIKNQQSEILNRLLLETDAPYMAPTPHRGERNESRFMALVAERLAQVLNVSVDEIIEATSANARQLFGIK